MTALSFLGGVTGLWAIFWLAKKQRNAWLLIIANQGIYSVMNVHFGLWGFLPMSAVVVWRASRAYREWT